MDTTRLAASIGDASDDAIALIDGSNQITYGQLRKGVSRTAGGLLDAGLTPGDQVAILAGNEPIFVEALLACWHAGLTAVPLNNHEPAASLEKHLAQPQIRAVLHGASQQSLESVANIDRSSLLAVGTSASGSGVESPCIDGEPRSNTVSLDQPALISQTSGVSSIPRPALLSHRNLSATQASLSGRTSTALDPETVSLGALPFVHILGINVSLLATLAAGGTTVLQGHWSSELAMSLIAEHGVNALVLVPTMWADLASLDDIADAALANVRLARSGAADLRQAVATSVFDNLGLRLGQGYGLTETAGTVSYEPDSLTRPGSVGRPLDHVQIRVVDGDRDAEPGDPGEIWIRGDCVFAGYADGLDETNLFDGWLRTGDLGVLDNELYIVGRLKEMISVSGFKISPLEVEDVLCLDTDVDSAMVVGEPDPRTGERVVAYVVARDRTIDASDLQTHVRSHLARYKVPKEIYIVDSLPRTAFGKTQRGKRPQPIGATYEGNRT